MKITQVAIGDYIIFNLSHAEYKPRPESNREIIAEVIEKVDREFWVRYNGPKREHVVGIIEKMNVNFRQATRREVFVARLEGKV